MRLRRDYFRGLNYLINEEPDKAVDVFIKLMEIDSDTVETHLALGGLFRRRGEVDRAIKIHKNLTARPQLSFEHRQLAMQELGEDYLSAGVLDRAEEIFTDLSEKDNQDSRCLVSLLQIYYLEKEWHKAIKTAQRLSAVQGRSYRKHIAQYYCELYEATNKSSTLEARLFLKRAISIDRHCVRAYLLSAACDIADRKYGDAIECLEKVMDEDYSYVIEVLPLMSVCYQQRDEYHLFIEYLEDMFAINPVIDIANYLAEDIKKKHGLQVAIDFLENAAALNASPEALRPLIKLYAESASIADKQKLLKLGRQMELIFINQETYRCVHCGFSGKTLYWLCPGCQSWSTIKAIRSCDLQSNKVLV